MKLRYTTRAKDDLDIAFEWYEEQRRGLGFEFLDCVEVAIETIQQMPKLGILHMGSKVVYTFQGYGRKPGQNV